MATALRSTPEVVHRRKEGLLENLKRATGLEFSLGRRRGSRIARGARGTLYLPSAIEARADRWFLGLDERGFVRDDEARGVVLVCEGSTEVFDFWFPADEIKALLPRLAASGNERKFNVVRRRDRFLLKVPGEQDVDITAKRGDTSWLGGGIPSHSFPDPRGVLPPWQPPFLARIRKGRLEPLDATKLEEGAVVVVRVSPAAAVPRRSALRRIVAAAGDADLPPDFAEQHNHYAHGAPRR